MMKIKNALLGSGVPKICVPVTSTVKNKIIDEAHSILNKKADIAEWRADFFEDVLEIEKVEALLKELSSTLNQIPLLFTFRTQKDGGKKIDMAEYILLNKKAISTGYVDIIDIELSAGDRIVRELVEYAHSYGVKVIISKHDIKKTPSKDEMLCWFEKMLELGADIPKIAVTPKCRLDVLELMQASVIMSQTYKNIPFIAVSMSEIGTISRIAAEFCGSAITFGIGQNPSAPGQIAADTLYQILHVIHK